MEQERQKQPGINSQQSLWDEYLEDLEKTQQEKEAVKKDPNKAQISLQVEEDLLAYSHSNRKGRRNIPSVKKLIMIGGVFFVLTASVSAILFRSGASSQEVVYYEDPVEIESWDDDFAYVGDDISVPEFIFSDTKHQLPLAYSDFMTEDYKVLQGGFSSEVTEVGSDPVTLTITNSYGERLCDILVVSSSGDVVPLDQATIIGISVSNSGGYFELPGYISIYSDEYHVENVLEESGKPWQKVSQSGDREQYVFKTDIDGGEYSQYELTIDINEDMVNQITMKVDK